MTCQFVSPSIFAIWRVSTVMAGWEIVNQFVHCNRWAFRHFLRSFLLAPRNKEKGKAIFSLVLRLCHLKFGPFHFPHLLVPAYLFSYRSLSHRHGSLRPGKSRLCHWPTSSRRRRKYRHPVTQHVFLAEKVSSYSLLSFTAK
jgi:hypothetical protein